MKELQDKYAIHPFIYTALVCQHTPNLPVFTLNTHIWQTCLYGDTHTHTHTQVNTSGFTGVIRDSRLLSPSKAYQSMPSGCLSLSHKQTHAHIVTFLQAMACNFVQLRDISHFRTIIYVLAPVRARIWLVGRLCYTMAVKIYRAYLIMSLSHSHRPPAPVWCQHCEKPLS